jgi:hypothetical protein
MPNQAEANVAGKVHPSNRSTAPFNLRSTPSIGPGGSSSKFLPLCFLKIKRLKIANPCPQEAPCGVQGIVMSDLGVDIAQLGNQGIDLLVHVALVYL